MNILQRRLLAVSLGTTCGVSVLAVSAFAFIAYQTPDVAFDESPGSPGGAVVRTGGRGLRLIESKSGWYYREALFLPDCDGDGWADLSLSSVRSSTCGNDVEGRLDVISGATLTPICAYSGLVDFRLELSEVGELLMIQEGGWGYPSMKMLDGIKSGSRWTEPFGEEVAFVGDVDGDGSSDVALGKVWASVRRGDLEPWEGSVELRSGRNGHLLWTGHAGPAGARFGYDVAPAGDRNGDGVPDVVGIAHHSLAILSGIDGSVLREVEFPPEDEMWRVRPIGDLDGDGFEELLLHEESLREYVHPVVYSSATWRPLDVARGWRIAWATADGDLDGDGLDDLLIGRIQQETGERRLSMYSQGGIVDVRTIHPSEPSWERVWKAQVGRFRADGPWSALLVLLPEGGYFNTSGTVVIVPGV